MTSNTSCLDRTDKLKAWEVSQSFVDKWWWLLGDEVIAYSDFWRAERGESSLQVPVIDIGEIIEEAL